VAQGPSIWRGPRDPLEKGVRIPPPDHTAFDLYFFRDISAPEFTRTTAQAVAGASVVFPMDAMSADAREWLPFAVDGASRILSKAEEVPELGQRGALYAASSYIRVELEVFWNRPIHRGANVLRLACLSQRLSDEAVRANAVSAFIGICEACVPDYACAMPTAEFYEKCLIVRYPQEMDGRPQWAPCTAPPFALNGVFWLNWFGPSYRREFGDRRLLSMPSLWTRTTGQGIATCNADGPLDFAARPPRLRAKKAVAHLGARAFVAKSDNPAGWQRPGPAPYI
jgi:hypothetical protein